MNIHGNKLKVKSLKEDLKEIEENIRYYKGELRKGKERLGFQEWNRINRLTEQLETIKKDKKSKKKNIKEK